MCHAVLAVVSNCCPPLKGRFLTRYSPVRHFPLHPLDESSFSRFSFDLHVLSTPPAFILSQDQTLMLKVLIQPEYLAFPNQKQVPTGILIQVLLFLRFALLKAVRSSFDDLNYSLMNLSRLFTVQLSMFSVVFSNSDMLS